MDLQNKKVWITGGTRGIGKGVAKAMLDAGATVIISGIHTEIGEKTKVELGDNCYYFQLDVRDPNQVKEVVQKIVNEFSEINVLVNNAGIIKNDLLIKKNENEIFSPQLSLDHFDEVMDTNLKGAFYCTREVAAVMANNKKGGVIINTSSIVGEDGSFGQTNYVASKFGIIGMTKVWARELARFNIRVNTVAPGLTQTDLAEEIPLSSRNDLISKTPLRRIGTPEDIAPMYVFLASDMSKFATGATFRVDGGLSIGS